MHTMAARRSKKDTKQRMGLLGRRRAARSSLQRDIACPFTHEIWRYHILPFCSLGSLLRLAWTCQGLRDLLNDPAFVVEWQSGCWYMYRECRCSRNLFYLHMPQFCTFSYDYSPVLDSQWEARIRLRDLGRSPHMHVMAHNLDGSTGGSFTRGGRFCDPLRTHGADFHPGVFQSWIENLLVPMPRMVGVHVEDTLLAPRNEPRREDESQSDYDQRQYWRNFHDVNEAVRVQRRGQTLPSGFIPFAYREAQSLPGVVGMVSSETQGSVDVMGRFLERCRREGRDPYDPADDPDCEGHQVAQWARTRMYESLVGNLGYPLELCLRREELDPPYAHANGVDYIERLFISVDKIHPHATCMDHRGALYFYPVRYTNERGDLVNWVLATWACENAVYHHVWFDTAYQYLELLARYTEQLAREIEQDTRRESVCERWQRIAHLIQCRQCQTPHAHYHRVGEDGERDARAVQFTQNSTYGAHFHRLACMIRHWSALRDETPGMVANAPARWLSAFVPQGVAYRSTQRSEAQLVRDMDTMLEVLSFVTEFGEHLGRRMDAETEATRRRTLRLYLSTGYSLVAFSPTWRREPSYRPSQTAVWCPPRMPRALSTENHRYNTYLNFLNRRSLYYQPEASMARHAEHEDLGRWIGAV